MSAITNSSQGVSIEPEHIRDHSHYFDPVIEVIPAIKLVGDIAISNLPNYKPTTLFEKNITRIATKCGQLGTKFTYVASEDIFSYGNRYSLTTPVIFGPIKEFNEVEEFLIAKQICKIKDPNLLAYSMGIFYLFSVFVGTPCLYFAGNTPLALALSVTSLIGLFPVLIISGLAQQRFVIQNDLQAAKATGFDKAIKALEKLKVDNELNISMLNPQPTYDRRIANLKSFQFLEQEIEEEIDP